VTGGERRKAGDRPSAQEEERKIVEKALYDPRRRLHFNRERKEKNAIIEGEEGATCFILPLSLEEGEESTTSSIPRGYEKEKRGLGTKGGNLFRL